MTQPQLKANRAARKTDTNQVNNRLDRRQFVKYSFSVAAGLAAGSFTTGCSDRSDTGSYLINSSRVKKTSEQMLAFDRPLQPTTLKSNAGLHPIELSQVQDYDKFGYGQYRIGKGLAVVPRYDLLAKRENIVPPTRLKRLASFFAMTDIHITDKEAPNQFIYIQQADKRYAAMTSVYSPVICYTTQMLDAAIQTVNALHEQTPFDFGISLGDVCDSGRYNELRWYIDVFDGKQIRPSSGAHLGEDTVDFQKPFQAVGLNKAIPWYQVLGNHDHFFIGSVPVDAKPFAGLRESYVSDKVWASGNVLIPNASTSTKPALPPVIYDMSRSLPGGDTAPLLDDKFTGVKGTTFYMGVVDGASPYGAIKYAGEKEQFERDFGSPPTVAPDRNRRFLLRSEWIAEFFNTTTQPKGHGFDLVPNDLRRSEDGFACYSFVPRADVPLKVIVLDNTQREDDGSLCIHGHGFLDKARWQWLQNELDAGQKNNQLMVIAAHIPIAVAAAGSMMEWWKPTGQATDLQNDPNAVMDNAVTLPDLINKLQDTPNLLMWIAGHRHLNTVKALPAHDAEGKLIPEKSFWQVETSSLLHFPQQFRTFEVFLNSDDTVSIVAINVDPEVADGTPAAMSRKCAVAEHQILQSDLRGNAENDVIFTKVPLLKLKVDSMDPTRPQNSKTDPSIEYGQVEGVPYCASYNAELFKKLTPTMIEVLKTLA